MDYVQDLNADEIRSGFFVTSRRKRLWNVQIKLILEFDRICRKHDIKWFAYAGTLLGAARHNGFIPWDDDVDLCMLRPDYDKFLKVAPAELAPNYFLDFWCDYRLEEEADFTPDTAEYAQFPIMSKGAVNTIREKKWRWPTYAGYFKIRDSNTTMIQWSKRRHVNQGIWIDVFALDSVPPFDTPEQERNFYIGKELLDLASNRPKFLERMKKNEALLTPPEMLKELVDLPFHERALAYEKHMAKIFVESQYCCTLIRFIRKKHRFSMSNFESAVELPFEQSKVNVPVNYDAFLKTMYGDWHKEVFSKGHARNFSDNISYKDYFEKVTLK